MFMNFLAKYAAAGLSAAMLLMFIYFKVTINSLEATNNRLKEDVEALQAEVINSDRNTAICKLALARQTNEVEASRADHSRSVKELNKWKGQPLEIRYNTIYKTITKYDYSKGDCNETKKLISDISNINYDDI